MVSLHLFVLPLLLVMAIPLMIHGLLMAIYALMLLLQQSKQQQRSRFAQTLCFCVLLRCACLASCCYTISHKLYSTASAAATLHVLLDDMVFRNFTTNERINAWRYSYLKDAQGNFFNPFDEGKLNNFLVFFKCKSARPVNQAEIMTAHREMSQDEHLMHQMHEGKPTGTLTLTLQSAAYRIIC